MISKSWLCVLLTAVVLICGCGEAAKTPKAEKKTASLTSNIVKLKTSMGDIVIELNEQAAPVTAKNFIRYVEEGFYDGTIFHRVIHGFMIQGGGLTPDMVRKETRDPITNEANNGLRNERGTIAMARNNDPHSATSQFFINHTDNMPLDYVANVKPGYAVFGKVTGGMDVVDAIAKVATTTREVHHNISVEQVMIMHNVPVESVVTRSARIVPQ